LLDAPFEPKAVQQPRLPVLIGASAPRMLRLTARHADNWNARGNPAEVGASNRDLDRLCLEIGRDPAAIIRSISVGLQAWSSPETFADLINAYRAEGFTDFRIPWPRSAPDYATFVRISDEVIPRLRAS
jgi:alkanesulfonate monooxygenase SsuD/methylene tetrahydromethanopterin reductase-like flavin-dependent oxidoreductase (luciferase family)